MVSVSYYKASEVLTDEEIKELKRSEEIPFGSDHLVLVTVKDIRRILGQGSLALAGLTSDALVDPES